MRAKATAKAPKGSERTETSVTLWTGHIRYSPSRWLGLGIRENLAIVIASYIPNPSSRPWECGNPEGISKECGKGGKPALWLSMLSTLCHFHGLL
jgi:hypothetical protein